MNVLEAAGFNVVCVVEVVRQALAGFDVKLHIALHNAVLLTIAGKESKIQDEIKESEGFILDCKLLQFELVAEDTTPIRDGQRPDRQRAICSLGSEFNKGFLVVRQHALNRPLAWKQIVLVYEDFYSLAVH